MVMVHAAATWNPFSDVQDSLLAYVVSGLGGLAAPLFVTLFGWGVVRTQSRFRQRIAQALFLLVAQIVVNLTSPHIFNPYTPGVLSLMAVLTLVVPWVCQQLDFSRPHTLFVLIGAIFSIQLLDLDIQGTGQWSDRIGDGSITVILSNLFLTGTYPVFPWAIFAFLGATISLQPELESMPVSSAPSVRWGVGVGLLYCTVTYAYALSKNLLWAHPSEDAILTFFPANSPFLIAGMTGVLLSWMLIQRFGFSHLASAGKLSLSVYIVHFIPLTLMRDFEATHQWGLQTSIAAVTIYTLAWIPFAAVWLRMCPKVSVERVLKWIRKSL